MTASPTHEPLQFAYWVPNVSPEAWSISDIEQRTDWGYDFNKKLAQTSPRTTASTTPSPRCATRRRTAPPTSTRRPVVQPRAAARDRAAQGDRGRPPLLWHPGVLAKFIATADHLVRRPGRDQRRLRLVQGRGRSSIGVPLARARRALPPLPRSSSAYLTRDLDLRARRVQRRLLPAARLRPEAQAAGQSRAARTRRSSRAATPWTRRRWPAGSRDWYFANGNTPDGIAEQIADVVGRRPSRHGRTVRFGVNGFMVARDTEAEAKRRARARSSPRPTPRRSRASATRSSRPASPPATRRACGRTRDFSDLVQYNDGFRTGLVGTPEQVAHRMLEFKKPRREPVPARLPALPRGRRVLRRERAADRPRARG